MEEGHEEEMPETIPGVLERVSRCNPRWRTSTRHLLPSDDREDRPFSWYETLCVCV